MKKMKNVSDVEKLKTWKVGTTLCPLNLRVGSSVFSDVERVLEKGEKVQIAGVDGIWCRTTEDKFCMIEYLEIKDD